MGIYCILCGKTDKSVSYIRFPSNKHLRKQWLQFCKKSEKYLYDSHRLCTDHFKSEDLRKRSRCTLVQPKAVPCIYLESTTENIHTASNRIKATNSSHGTPKKSQDFVKEDVNSNRENKKIVKEDIDSNTEINEHVDSGHCNKIGNCELPLNIRIKKDTDSDIEIKEDTNSNIEIKENTNSNIEINEHIDSAHCIKTSNCKIPLNNCSTSLKQQKDAPYNSKRKCLDFHSTELISNDNIDSVTRLHDELPVSEESTLTSAICNSAPSMISDPRYVGDIQLSHFATPRQATRTMNVIRRTVMQQRQKIETLQKKFNRCKQRISLLKDLVSNLKKRNYISETVANHLMVHLNNIYRSMEAPNKVKTFVDKSFK